MLPRFLADQLRAALEDSPVTTLVGARQTGKTTLVQSLSREGLQLDYLTLDDAGVLAAAGADPAGFIRGLAGPVALDEVQRVPELFPAIKLAVDRDRRPGRFLLTGSANVLFLPQVSESLAGRMEILTLWPLSQGELRSRRECLLDRLFGEDAHAEPELLAPDELIELIVSGGYPPAAERRTEARRAAWFGSYLSAVVQRDVRELANIDRLRDLPRLLAAVAARTTGILNTADLGRDLAIPQTSLQRYMTLLENVFLVVRVPAWHKNVGQRLLKSPKILLNDSGLAAHLLGTTSRRLREDRALLGKLLENLVGMELVKQASWSPLRASVLHYRTTKGLEVDYVLEDAAGRIAGVEVKASATVGSGDFNGLRSLADRAGADFVRGVVLYTGDVSVPFSETLAAWPIGSLWMASRGPSRHKRRDRLSLEDVVSGPGGV